MFNKFAFYLNAYRGEGKIKVDYSFFPLIETADSNILKSFVSEKTYDLDDYKNTGIDDFYLIKNTSEKGNPNFTISYIAFVDDYNHDLDYMEKIVSEVAYKRFVKSLKLAKKISLADKIKINDFVFKRLYSMRNIKNKRKIFFWR